MSTTVEKKHDAIDMRCSVSNALNFILNSKLRVGYITGLKFASGLELTQKTEVQNPEDPDKKLSILGVIETIKWEGAPTDPVEVEGRLSPGNAGQLKNALLSLTGGSELEVTYAVYDYDHDKEKYYQSFHTFNKPISFTISEGTKVQLAGESAEDITQPTNFWFKMSLTGKNKAKEQELGLATSETAKFPKPISVMAAAS